MGNYVRPRVLLRTVRLTNGEIVKLYDGDISGVERHQFIRLGVKLVISVFCQRTKRQIPAIYIWQQVRGVYYYIGDTTFVPQGDGSVMWNIWPCTPDGEPKKRAEEFLKEQCGHHGNHVKVLSMTTGPNHISF